MSTCKRCRGTRVEAHDPGDGSGVTLGDCPGCGGEGVCSGLRTRSMGTFLLSLMVYAWRGGAS